MTNLHSSDGTCTPAEPHHLPGLLSRADSFSLLPRRWTSRLSRIVYHSFIGGFLALIPAFWVLVANVFPSPERGIILFSAWLALTVMYTIWRIRTEHLLSRIDAPLNRKVWAFIAVPRNALCVVFLVSGHSFIKNGFHRDFYVVTGCLTVLWLFGCFAKFLENIAQLAQQNRVAVETWVVAGSDEEERSRRRAYIQSRAHAVAAAMTEYDDAPNIDWMTQPDLSSSTSTYDVGCFDAGFSTTYYNPSTGLQMMGDTPCGIDVGGNLWGHNSFD